jgi:hypothetical protein
VYIWVAITRFSQNRYPDTCLLSELKEFALLYFQRNGLLIHCAGDAVSEVIIPSCSLDPPEPKHH